MGQIWKDIHADPEVRVAVVTGAGSAFSAGGDFEMVSGILLFSPFLLSFIFVSIFDFKRDGEQL